jgi:hypothetical protein
VSSITARPCGAVDGSSAKSVFLEDFSASAAARLGGSHLEIYGK